MPFISITVFIARNSNPSDKINKKPAFFGAGFLLALSGLD